MIKRKTKPEYQEKILHGSRYADVLNNVKNHLEEGWIYHKEIVIPDTTTSYGRICIILRKKCKN